MFVYGTLSLSLLLIVESQVNFFLNNNEGFLFLSCLLSQLLILYFVQFQLYTIIFSVDHAAVISF